MNVSASELINRAWAMEPNRLSSLIEQLEHEPPAEAKLDTPNGGSGMVSRVGPVAVLAIEGTLMRKPDWISRWLGATSTIDSAAEFRALEADPAVQAIVMDIDSPGGEVTGTQEMGTLIKNSTKPTVAFSSGLMASASYWLGSQADEVFASPSAQVGSIGVLLPVIDLTGMRDKLGVRVHLLRSGPQKSPNFLGTSITTEQAEFLQAMVDSTFQTFVSAVKAKRPALSQTMLDGRIATGAQGAQLGLVAGTADDLSILLQTRVMPRLAKKARSKLVYGARGEPTTFEAACWREFSKPGVTKADAVSVAAKEFPGLYEDYRKRGTPPLFEPALTGGTPNKQGIGASAGTGFDISGARRAGTHGGVAHHSNAFVDLVRKLTAGGLTKARALEKAIVDHPEAYGAWRESGCTPNIWLYDKPTERTVCLSAREGPRHRGPEARHLRRGERGPWHGVRAA